MDDKNLRGRQDRGRVSASQLHEVRYLSEKFGVDRQIVVDAIRTCGGSRENVEEYLKERTGRGRGPHLSGSRSAPEYNAFHKNNRFVFTKTTDLFVRQAATIFAALSS